MSSPKTLLSRIDSKFLLIYWAHICPWPQVGDVILSVGDSFCSNKLAHAIDSELLGPMGTSVKVRLNRPPTPGVPGTGGQFYATIVRQV